MSGRQSRSARRGIEEGVSTGATHSLIHSLSERVSPGGRQQSTAVDLAE